MRRRLPLLLLSLLLVLAACGGEASQDPPAAASQSAASQSASSQSAPSQSGPLPGKVRDVGPTPVPDLTLTTLDGASIDLQAQEGRLLLVNFWATWCAPCREEIPDLKALHADLHEEGLRVIGIALDREGREVVAPFVDKLDIPYPIVIDSDGAAESAFGPLPGLPTTLLVTPDGQVTKRVLGIFPAEEMRSTLEQMLNSDGASSGTT